MLVSRLRGLFAGHAPDRELDRDIEEHLHSLAERLIRQGMSREDAEHAARRQFGGVTELREYHRETALAAVAGLAGFLPARRASLWSTVLSR